MALRCVTCGLLFRDGNELGSLLTWARGCR